MRLFAENGFGRFLSLRHSCHAADEDDFVDLVFRDTGVPYAGFAGGNGALEKIVAKFFELSAGQRDLHVERTALVHCDERQIDFRAHAGGKFAFRLFRRFFQTLERLRIVAEIDAVFFLECVREPVDNRRVEIVAAEVSVAVGGFHFEYAITDLKNGDIERSATEVVNRDGLFRIVLVKPIGESRRSRFVDDTLDVKTSDPSGIFGCLTLAVVEVSGNRDNRFGDFFAEERFRIGFEFLKDHRGDFRRGVGFSAGNDCDVAVFSFGQFIRHTAGFIAHFIVLASHEAFDGEDRIFGVGHSLTFCGLTDKTFPGFCECDDRRSRVGAFRIRDDFKFTLIHYSHTAVGRSQVDTKNFSHNNKPFLVFCFRYLPLNLAILMPTFGKNVFTLKIPEKTDFQTVRHCAFLCDSVCQSVSMWRTFVTIPDRAV